MFKPVFEDNYQDFLTSLKESSQLVALVRVPVRVFYVTRFGFWTYLLLRQCIRTPYQVREAKSGRRR